MLVKEHYGCTSHVVIGLLGRCGSLWLTFMALGGPVDPKTRRGSPLEIHEEVLEMVALLARRDTQEEALKNGLRDQWTQKIYQISRALYMIAEFMFNRLEAVLSCLRPFSKFFS